LRLLKRSFNHMKQELTDAISALNDEVADSQGKLESIKTYLEGLPDVVATAVQKALEAADADEATAAEQVNAARETFSNSVDETLASINENPAPTETPVEEPPVE
jgi:peptidoglycan hydrolase CwlO-like protein